MLIEQEITFVIKKTLIYFASFLKNYNNLFKKWLKKYSRFAKFKLEFKFQVRLFQKKYFGNKNVFRNIIYDSKNSIFNREIFKYDEKFNSTHFL